ncbi:MAG: YihY/virulence factor BrkB family protein [Streptosporangiaceae bacterium]|nr:YihY/virulence factor BrkB family protein [Streptosporangiaceae bacterium]
MGRLRKVRSAVQAQQAEQAELDALERQQRQRLSMVVRTRADEHQRLLHRRFPRLPYRFVAPVAEVAARPRIDDLGTHAGALAYGSFLAVPPLLLFASSVLGFVFAGHPQAAQDAVNELVKVVPGLGSVVTAEMQAAVAGRVTLGVIGLFGLLWTASGFASRLRHALGVIFRTQWVGLLTGRLRGTVIGLLMVAVFVALAGFTAIEAELVSGHRATLAAIFQFAAFAGGCFVLFLATYRLLTPGKGITLRDHVPGTVAFTVAWLVLTVLGGVVYAQLIQKSTVLYGTIGGIFGFLAFLYATVWSLLIGAELSAVLMSRRKAAPR